MIYSNNNTHTLLCTQGGDCRRVSTESTSRAEGDKYPRTKEYGKFPYTQNTQGTIDFINDINNENVGAYDNEDNEDEDNEDAIT